MRDPDDQDERDMRELFRDLRALTFRVVDELSDRVAVRIEEVASGDRHRGPSFAGVLSGLVVQSLNLLRGVAPMPADPLDDDGDAEDTDEPNGRG